MELTIREDDLTGSEIRTLLVEHLADLALHSPMCSMHAMPINRLQSPDVTFWSAWSGHRVVGCGALKEIDTTHCEVKSMRTVDEVRGQGVGGFVLDHLLGEARNRGYSRASLETGSNEPFRPAHGLYAGRGFEVCGPFADYAEDPWSLFMTLELA